MITSRANVQVRRYRALISDPEQGLVCLEGHKLISDCEGSGAIINELYISPRGKKSEAAEQLIDRAAAKGAQIWEVSDELMDYMCDTERPQGIAAIAEWDLSGEIDAERPIIALDGIQDPGNVGAIIRSGAAFGFASAILGPNTAKAYSPKAVRSSMGAIYRMSVLQVRNLSGTLEGLKDCGIEVLALDMAGSGITGPLAAPFCLVVGSEGSGLSQEVRSLADRFISIPMKEGVESLNASVAASVAMWELAGRSR